MFVAGFLLTLPLLSRVYAAERDGIDYYMAHLSEYKGKEIQILAHNASIVTEKSIKEGYVDTFIATDDGVIHCLIKKDRIDAFMRRYKDSDPKILRGTLLVTENENPYLLIAGF